MIDFVLAVTEAGLNPPMIWPRVESPGVSSTIETQVAPPKPEISLRPSMVGVEVLTIVLPPAVVPPVSLGATWTGLVVVLNSIGARLMVKAPSP